MISKEARHRAQTGERGAGVPAMLPKANQPIPITMNAVDNKKAMVFSSLSLYFK